MRKSLFLIFSLLMLCSCSKATDSTPEPVTPTISPIVEAEETVTEAPLFPHSEETTSERAFAVMIDNRRSASRPHAGLEDASIIYEMYTNGGSTGIMAIYKGASTPKIGPVYYSEESFSDYILDNDAILASLSTPTTSEEFSHIDTLSSAEGDSTYFWSEIKDSAQQQYIYTSVSNLTNYATELDYSLTTNVLPFSFSSLPPSYEGESATDITIPYADFYYLSYKYDPSTGLYDRFVNSEYHPTQSGEKLQAGQIILQFTPAYYLQEGDTDMVVETSGNGEGIFISGGIQTPITWIRDEATSKLTFFTSDGNELILNDSKQTYIQLLPKELEYSIK